MKLTTLKCCLKFWSYKNYKLLNKKKLNFPFNLQKLKRKMGLDIFFYPGYLEEEEDIIKNRVEYYESITEEVDGNKVEIKIIPHAKLRVVDHFPHINFRQMHLYRKDELVEFLIDHIFQMMRIQETYEYPSDFNKYWTDTREDEEINLRSDILILIDFIEGLRGSDIPNDYRVWMDY